MWFFRKKLTQEQRISLGKWPEELNSLTQAKEAAFAAALRDVADLLANCMAGQDSGAGRPLVPPAASEIIAARETLLAYEDTAWPSISELERVNIQSGFRPSSRNIGGRFYHSGESLQVVG